MEYVYEYQFEKDRGHDYSDEFFEILQKRNHILKTKKAVVHKFHYFYYALAAVFLSMLSILFGAETDSDFYKVIFTLSIYLALFWSIIGCYLFIYKLRFRKRYCGLCEKNGVVTLSEDTISDECQDVMMSYKQEVIKKVVFGREIMVFFVDKHKPFIMVPRVDFKEETFLKLVKEIFHDRIVYWKRIS